MDSKSTVQHNKLMQLENSVLMCGVYNEETLEKTYQYSTPNTQHYIIT